MIQAGRDLRCTLFSFVFLGFGLRLFFAENPGTDDAELIHHHQRKRHHHLGDHVWRREYGGLKVDQARRLKDLERENQRLRKAVSNLTLDALILKEAVEGKY